MSAAGWALMDKSTSENLMAVIGPVTEEGKQICLRAEYQELLRKIPCDSSEATPEQLADKGRLSPSEKVALVKMTQERKEFNDKVAAAHRQHNLATGAAVADVYERAAIEYERLVQELTEGRISRGEFNKRKLEMSKKQIVELQRVSVR
jgi:hypothetical protein